MSWIRIFFTPVALQARAIALLMKDLVKGKTLSVSFKSYEFMKQFVINGRNMLDVFRERIGGVKEWVQRKVGGGSR